MLPGFDKENKADFFIYKLDTSLIKKILIRDPWLRFTKSLHADKNEVKIFKNYLDFKISRFQDFHHLSQQNCHHLKMSFI